MKTFSGISLFAFALISVATSAQSWAAGIEIVKANYSLECKHPGIYKKHYKGHPEDELRLSDGYATAHVRQYCEGKTACTYTKGLGGFDPAPGCPIELRGMWITYRCNGVEQTITKAKGDYTPAVMTCLPPVPPTITEPLEYTPKLPPGTTFPAPLPQPAPPAPTTVVIVVTPKEEEKGDGGGKGFQGSGKYDQHPGYEGGKGDGHEGPGHHGHGGPFGHDGPYGDDQHHGHDDHHGGMVLPPMIPSVGIVSATLRVQNQSMTFRGNFAQEIEKQCRQEMRYWLYTEQLSSHIRDFYVENQYFRAPYGSDFDEGEVCRAVAQNVKAVTNVTIEIHKGVTVIAYENPFQMKKDCWAFIQTESKKGTINYFRIEEVKVNGLPYRLNAHPTYPKYYSIDQACDQVVSAATSTPAPVIPPYAASIPTTPGYPYPNGGPVVSPAPPVFDPYASGNYPPTDSYPPVGAFPSTNPIPPITGNQPTPPGTIPPYHPNNPGVPGTYPTVPSPIIQYGGPPCALSGYQYFGSSYSKYSLKIDNKVIDGSNSFQQLMDSLSMFEQNKMCSPQPELDCTLSGHEYFSDAYYP